MKSVHPIWKCCLALLLITIAGCVTTPPFDYSLFRSHRPRSILVLPPLNQTTDVNAPYSYLSTITRPLAECGYYVYPVAVVDAYMKENGLPSAEEMHGVALKKNPRHHRRGRGALCHDRGMGAKICRCPVDHDDQGQGAIDRHRLGPSHLARNASGQSGLGGRRRSDRDVNRRGSHPNDRQCRRFYP